MDQKVRTIKLLEENTEINLCDLGLHNVFLGITQAQATTEKTTTLRLSKSTILCVHNALRTAEKTTYLKATARNSVGRKRNGNREGTWKLLGLSKTEVTE